MNTRQPATDVQAHAPQTQHPGKSHARVHEAIDWEDLERQCETLQISMHTIQVEQTSLEEAVAAIDATKQSASYKHGQRKKLLKRVLRAIEAVRQPAADSRAPADIICAPDSDCAPSTPDSDIHEPALHQPTCDEQLQPAASFTGDSVNWMAAYEAVDAQLAAMGVNVPSRALTRSEAMCAAEASTRAVSVQADEAATLDDIAEWRQAWQWQVGTSSSVAAPVPSTFKVGMRVILTELVSSAHLNGHTAIISYYEAAAPRARVQLERTGPGGRREYVKPLCTNMRRWAMTRSEFSATVNAPPTIPCCDLPTLNASLPIDFVAFNEDVNASARLNGTQSCALIVRTFYVHRDGQRSLYRPTGDARTPGVSRSFGDFDGPCGDAQCEVCKAKEHAVNATVEREIARHNKEVHCSV
jgi:hypothetical protein